MTQYQARQAYQAGREFCELDADTTYHYRSLLRIDRYRARDLLRCCALKATEAAITACISGYRARARRFALVG